MLKLKLSDYAGKRIAVLVRVGQEDRVFRGVAAYEQDPLLGVVLKVRAEQERSAAGGPTSLVFQLAAWEGALVPDKRHGCDFSVAVDRAGSEPIPKPPAGAGPIRN